MRFVGRVIALMAEVCTECLHESLEGRYCERRLDICGRIMFGLVAWTGDQLLVLIAVSVILP